MTNPIEKEEAIVKKPIQIGLPSENSRNGISILYRVLLYMFWLFIIEELFFIDISSNISLFEFIMGPNLSDCLINQCPEENCSKNETKEIMMSTKISSKFSASVLTEICQI